MASVDTAEQSKKFAEEHQAKFPLLCDTSQAVTKLYGVGVKWEDELYSDRWTIYIDKEGIIKAIDKKVNVRTAGADLAKKLAELKFPKVESK